MKSEYFNIAFKNLKNRKLRSWLTVIGIFISIATIFTLISLSLGLEKAVEEQFELLGADKFFIQPKTGFLASPGSTGVTILTEEDIEVVSKVNGIKDYSYFVAANAKVEFSDEIRYFMVWGIPPENLEVYLEVGALKIEEGRFLEKGDKNSVILGNHFKTKNLLGRQIRVGDKIEINGQKVKVKGIMELIGNPEDDKAIMIDIESFREIFEIPNRVDYIMLQVEEGEEVSEIAERTERKLRKFRDLKEENQDFSILTLDEILESFKNILGIITYFLAGIAAISLLVGAIGIANTMYTSVLERTREIGVMKAIGAKNSDILWIFLIESGLLGLVGGIVGIILGYGISKMIEFIIITQFETELLSISAPFYLIIGCLIFSFIIGSISGTLPAIQASRTNVSDALRYE
jgi:putative ABC transport system permease protein